METKDEDPIAEANGSFLYASDLMTLEWANTDTIIWNDAQVEAWVLRQLWYAQAKKNGVNPEIQDKLEDYKESLMIAAYRQILLDQANIVISEDMILRYYQDNKASYTLDTDLFKLNYYVLGNDDKIEESLSLLNQNLEVDYLNSYCANHLGLCMSNGLWVGSQVLEDIGLPQYLWLSSSKFQKYYREDNFVCIYRIEGKKKIGEAAPLAQVRAEIVEVLKFQKENEVLKKTEEELFLNAQNKKNFEIYK
jgi:hypothetical protein